MEPTGKSKSVESVRIPMKSSVASIDQDGYQHQNGDDFDNQSGDNSTDSLFKPNSFEKYIFTLVYAMVKENELPYFLAIFLMVLEDIQLFSFSWRESQVNTLILRWVFNPFLAFVENATFASHIISWVILVTVVVTMVYCGLSLMAGQIRFMIALHTLRFLTIIASTILYIPIFETFIMPTTCVGDIPWGYSSLKCYAGEHTIILITAIVGAVLVTVFAIFMSLLYFDSEVSSKVGKRHGRVDVFYVAVRVVLVVIEKRLELLNVAIVNTVLLAVLVIYFVSEQPFYNSALNNIRAAFFTAAFALSGSNLIYTAVKANSPAGMIAGGISVLVVVGVLAYFGNEYYVQWQSKTILTKLKQYDLVIGNKQNNQDAPARLQELRKSYMELLYDTSNEVIKRKAIIEKVQVFPAPHWVEIAARFVHQSYMDRDALTLANRILEVGTLQYGKSGAVYLSYLGYIKAFFPFLKGKERIHMSIMLRKCNLIFDQRFLVYLQQQSIQQLNQMGDVAGEDGDLQYTSYIEYQSLENAAKKSHVETLAQLRDFWNAVRSEANDYALSARLNKISSLAYATNALYQKLVTRFPNSRNVFLLYGRFHAMVTADFDQAAIYRGMGDDMEVEKITEDESVGGPRTTGEDLERRSAHSRGSSEGSRETRLIRQKRTLLTSRLQMPITEFLRRVTLASFAFIALLIGAIVFSKIAVDDTSNSLDNLDIAMVGRRMIHKIFSDVRRVSFAAESNDTKAFASYMKSLADNEDTWGKNVQPHLNKLVGNTVQNSILLWDSQNQRYQVALMNAYTASENLMNSLHYILDFNKTYPTQLQSRYQSRSVTSNNHYFRFVFDNLDPVYDLFDKDCLSVAQKYADSVTVSMAVVGSFFGALALLLLVAGLIIPHRYLSACLKTQDNVLGLFRKIPRSLVLKFVTDLEEEIEVISGENDHLASNSKSTVAADGSKGNTIKTRLTLRWEYLVLCFLILCAIPGMFYVVYLHLSVTQYVPVVYNWSNVRRTDMTQRIYALGQEVVSKDSATWIQPAVIAKMQESIDKMERLHAYVNKNLEPFLASGATTLFKALRSGNCWLATPEDCKKAAIPEIGYTEGLITSGVDTQIIRFISEGRIWIQEGNYSSIDNPRLRLMEVLARDLRVVLFAVIKNSILEIVYASIAQTSLILFLVMGITIGLALLAYYIGFWVTSRQFNWNNDQLVSLLYFVPTIERIKVPDMNTFIESGGAILN